MSFLYLFIPQFTLERLQMVTLRYLVVTWWLPGGYLVVTWWLPGGYLVVTWAKVHSVHIIPS